MAPFIKPNGFLVVHDEMGDINKKIELIFICGYKLIGTFVVPADAWWNDYYRLLEKRIHELREKYRNNSKILDVLDKEQREVEEYKKLSQISWFSFLCDAENLETVQIALGQTAFQIALDIYAIFCSMVYTYNYRGRMKL